MSKKSSSLEYIMSFDITKEFFAFSASADLGQKKKSERIREYAAFGVAYLHRLLPPYIGMLSLEAILAQGKIKEGVIGLVTSASGAALDIYLRKKGRNMDRNYAIVDYLSGNDIIEYVRVYEPLLRKLTHRGLHSRGMDYWIYFRMLLFGRLGPAALEMHGMVNLMKGNYKLGLMELAIGLYKNAMDYRSMVQRDGWISFYKMVEASGALPHMTNSIRNGPEVK